MSQINLQSTNNNFLDKIKIFLQKYVPVALLNFYRTYTYNLSIEVNQKPLIVIRKLGIITQKILNNRKKILFYPDFPYRKATLYQICIFLGYDVTNNPKDKFDIAIKWQRYTTFFTNEPILSDFREQNINVINFNCQDVSKSFTNRVFQQVFNYSISVDPLTYQGKCIVKSNLNAKHDGKIISCPIDAVDSEVVYQKFIDTEFKKNQVCELRVPIFKQTIPLVYVYIKTTETETQRFLGYPSLISVKVTEAEKIFDENEISKILNFCRQIGLDYGELDILRDRSDRQIYIVDANNTPSSRLLFEALELPVEKCLLSSGDRQIALQKMSEAFQKEFLNIDK
jgi:hypothetical protein